MFAKLGGFSYNAIMREYYVYILESKRNGTLQAGMTNDMKKVEEWMEVLEKK